MSDRLNAKSEKLKSVLLKRGYPEDFCRAVAEDYLNTEYTAGKMLGFLSNMPMRLSMDVIADEMIAILTDREKYIQKKINENSQKKLNLYMWERALEDSDY